MGARFVVGIDLGTTNSALAYADLDAPDGAVHDLPVPQLVAPGETMERRLLPSSAYLPAAQELPSGATVLPWGERAIIVGELARRQGARVPGRLVSSAKSWLCHAGVDRTAAILPWGAPEGVKRISPVQASSLYLAHLRDAWDHRFPDAPLAEQEVVLTVPASFDEVARELTVQAARQAALEHVTLLEEPLAAFYWWTARHADLGRALGEARLILVCDVGGGTSDFTLVHAAPGEKGPELSRIAVGDHILLGGDNVDVTLARRLEARLGRRIDAAQWAMLVHACRAAKEALLAPNGPAKTTVAIAGRGSRLVEGTISVELSREEVREVLLDGFFPRCGPDEAPARGPRAGLQEWGLPYAKDPAVTRHIAAFLRDHAPDVREATDRAGALPRPDAILLNGGVFTPPEVGERLREVVSGWFPGEPPVRLLDSDALDLVVARGAAWYGLVRRGRGTRVGGGSARAYFVGIDAPGKPTEHLLCLIPRHLEEGTEVDVPRTFSLVLDRPVRFPLYATTRARTDRPGDVAPFDEAIFEALPPIQTVLRSRGSETGEVPVRLSARLTEIGTLELWCVGNDGERWRLEFWIRAANESAAPAVPSLPRRFGEARALVERAFGADAARHGAKEVRALPRDLERILGPRDGWSTPVVRELWSVLYDGRAARRASPEHERVWLALTGYCLRPGFGAPLDDWRAAQTFLVFGEGLQFPDESATWSAWWILWRRIAGGLDATAQQRLFDVALPRLRPRPTELRRRPGDRSEGEDELVRMVASLERVPVAAKIQAGLWLLERAEKERAAPHLLWAIGRLGARVPFYAGQSACVPASQAGAWARRLLALARARPEDLALPLAQLARRTGDRARDVEPAVRAKVEARLAETRAPELLLRMVREVVEPGSGEEQRVFGESLPPGLRLLGSE